MAAFGMAGDRAQAHRLVDSYAGSVTLRQIFYRLVASGTIPNTVSAYKRLSAVTAEARRETDFPELADRGREITRAGGFSGVDNALEYLRAIYRRDRTSGQKVSVYLGVEKDGMVSQLSEWFADRGLPVVALRGYGSQTIKDVVRRDVEWAKRPGVLLYAGDFDPSGEDIIRDFVDRTACWQHVQHVALTAEQVHEFRLPPMPGKTTDSRAARFIATHGELVQVEVDALDPADLRQLFESALEPWWDHHAYEQVLRLEESDRGRLRRIR